MRAQDCKPSCSLEEGLTPPTSAAPQLPWGAPGSGSFIAQEVKGLPHVMFWQRTGFAQLTQPYQVSPNLVWDQPGERRMKWVDWTRRSRKFPLNLMLLESSGLVWGMGTNSCLLPSLSKTVCDAHVHRSQH